MTPRRELDYGLRPAAPDSAKPDPFKLTGTLSLSAFDAAGNESSTTRKLADSINAVEDSKSRTRVPGAFARWPLAGSAFLENRD